MTIPAELLDSWLNVDPDPATRRAIEAERLRPEWVEKHFGSVLRFGTAGMRAPAGPGPARMNRVMARIAARAVGSELIASGLTSRGAVVGFDARLGSGDMAFDAARLLAAMGIPTAIIDSPAPTPLLAHQVLARSAGAGLMITASHNHRDDNGLKVYWEDGTQIRPPLDQRIEARMDLSSLPDDGDLAARHEVEGLEVRSVIASYVGATVRRPVFDAQSQPVDPNDVPPIVYTALCGVGSQTLAHAFATAGLPPPIYVEHQRHPDGTFPELPFPNPEEPGTLDDAMALATDHDVDLVLANDPDADRLAVAVRDRDGAWHRLSGDELGVLLCDWLIGLHDRGRAGKTLISASSVVSGRMVEALCTARGVAHHRTLTGFKWIMEPRLTHPGARWVFGYEEALGYSVTDAVLDKDGISAAVEFARLASSLAARGISPLERLDELSAEVGLHVTGAASVHLSSEEISAAMSTLRTASVPAITGRPATNFTDWLGRDTSHPADLVEFELGPAAVDAPGSGTEATVRICVRPSGTEPKAKIYLEAVRPSPTDLRAERRLLQELLEAIAAEVVDCLFNL